MSLETNKNQQVLLKHEAHQRKERAGPESLAGWIYDVTLDPCVQLAELPAGGQNLSPHPSAFTGDVKGGASLLHCFTTVNTEVYHT